MCVYVCVSAQYAYPTISYLNDSSAARVELQLAVDKLNEFYNVDGDEEGSVTPHASRGTCVCAYLYVCVCVCRWLVAISNQCDFVRVCVCVCVCVCADSIHMELHIGEVVREDKWALFLAADCLLDTSVRDGLNLVRQKMGICVCACVSVCV